MAANGDMKPDEKTYDGFLWWVKWGSIITAILTVIVILLISN